MKEIKKGSQLYKAIEGGIYEIFNGEIEIEDPRQTTSDFVEYVNFYLIGKEEEEE